MNDLKGIIEDCNKSDLVSDKIIKKIIEIIGREEWQDLHDENNDICTTMGELIITLKGIAELEKENAELRKDKKELCHSISEGGKACVYLNEQLTKAKEIIKIFLKYEICTLNIKDELANNIAKAKAFLNSEVEK